MAERASQRARGHNHQGIAPRSAAQHRSAETKHTKKPGSERFLPSCVVFRVVRVRASRPRAFLPIACDAKLGRRPPLASYTGLARHVLSASLAPAWGSEPSASERERSENDTD